MSNSSKKRHQRARGKARKRAMLEANYPVPPIEREVRRGLTAAQERHMREIMTN